MRLECPQCIVRDWSPGDRDALVRAADNAAIARNMTHAFVYPYTVADAGAWLAQVGAHDEPTHWAIEVDGQAAGGIGIKLQPLSPVRG